MYYFGFLPLALFHFLFFGEPLRFLFRPFHVNFSTPSCLLDPTGVELHAPKCDYTPAKYITLLFTDLGVLTPAAVSDELIKLYQ